MNFVTAISDFGGSGEFNRPAKKSAGGFNSPPEPNQAACLTGVNTVRDLST
jgi:hypothetical protein